MKATELICEKLDNPIIFIVKEQKTMDFHSIGYGASFGGVSALLSMLNSCASGVSVVNIDSGFGAGYLASMMNHMRG